MKTFILNVETRKNDRDEVRGPFSTFLKAQNSLREYFDHWPMEKLKSYKKYGSNFDEGKIYTEEVSAEIYEREME